VVGSVSVSDSFKGIYSSVYEPLLPLRIAAVASLPPPYVVRNAPGADGAAELLDELFPFEEDIAVDVCTIERLSWLAYTSRM